MITLLSYGLLIAGCTLCAALLFRQPERLTDSNRSFALLIALSAGFIAASALGAMVLDAQSTDSQTMLRFLDNLKIYIALPLIASLILAAGFEYFFSRAAWGRWVLALFALFELLRRLGHGEVYTEVLLWSCVAALALGSVKLVPTVRVPGLLAAALLAASLFATTHTALANTLLAGSLALTGIACGRLINLRQRQATPDN